MQHKIYKKVVLVILDGFGVAPQGYGNAITQAKIPNFDLAVSNFPSLTLQASGPLVGLPWGEMGNSEVGHLNIGAGRIAGQDLPRINSTIQNREFFKNPAFLQCINYVKKNNSALHLVGMVSPGGVHSLDEHVYALLALAHEQGLGRVYIHMFTDGRDTEPKVALVSLSKLREKISQIGVGQIATITGRFYAMDRGGHWEQTLLTFDALVNGKGETAVSAEDAVNKAYAAQIFDETIKPTVILDSAGQPVGKISENDGIIFFNFRQDRAAQLAQALVNPKSLPEGTAKEIPKNLFFVTMTEYAAKLPVKVAFKTLELKNNLAEVIAASKLSQFHIAESEKYAHITSFFNCGRLEPFEQEGRVIVTSPNNANNYSDYPQMSAEPLTQILAQKILDSDINLFVANFANGDMVGHTGNLQAGIKAVESLDSCLSTLILACLKADAALIVTADHGNIEQMINPKSGDIDKDHTTSPVPFLLIADEFKFPKALKRNFSFLSQRTPAGALCDIAPTIADLFGLPKPAEMTGVNLLDEIDEVPKR